MMLLGESLEIDEALNTADALEPASKSVLGKAFLILECFRGDETLTLTELASRSDIPKTTVHRIASALIRWGALERVYGEYRLGLRLFELGGAVPRWRIVREAAMPFMHDLLDASRGTVHLGILDHLDVVYLEKLHGHRSPSVFSRCGGRLPAHCTGIGKVLVAFGPPDVQREVLESELERRTAYTITVPSVLRAAMDEIVERGYAIDSEEILLGIQCVAAPVLNRRGHAIAALSVTLHNEHFSAERLIPPVRRAATSLSRVLAPFADVL